MATAENEIKGGKLTRGRVRELEAAINGWHGELKAPEKPKEDKKDDKRRKEKETNYSLRCAGRTC